jgi:hypothetical protein
VAYGAYPRKGCATGARIGQVYLDLTQATGGAKFPVCDKDWRSMFEKLAQAVATKAPRHVAMRFQHHQRARPWTRS